MRTRGSAVTTEPLFLLDYARDVPGDRPGDDQRDCRPEHCIALAKSDHDFQVPVLLKLSRQIEPVEQWMPLPVKAQTSPYGTSTAV
jgi:hypothetical protein